MPGSTAGYHWHSPQINDGQPEMSTRFSVLSTVLACHTRHRLYGSEKGIAL
jgi:hypothetical protein